MWRQLTPLYCYGLAILCDEQSISVGNSLAGK